MLPAGDGSQALDVLGQEPVAVAVLDIGLPGMDGYQLARQIREARRRGIVLIALTGDGLATDAQRARAAGFDLHLTKPVDMARLARTIEEAGRSLSGAPTG